MENKTSINTRYNTFIKYFQDEKTLKDYFFKNQEKKNDGTQEEKKREGEYN